jgi:hypothetical protein
MAQKVTVALEDDLDGGPADETVRFGSGGLELGTRSPSVSGRSTHRRACRRLWAAAT